jgi:hypothetical protein
LGFGEGAEGELCGVDLGGVVILVLLGIILFGARCGI